MKTPAWRALSTTAQALYSWLKLEGRGPQNNNNGKSKFSVRQAANRIGVGNDTAARAFHDLQAKGFIVVTEMGTLGLSGDAKSPAHELTVIGLPYGTKRGGRCLYKEWVKGREFPIQKSRQNNPKGANGKTIFHHGNHHSDFIEIVTFRGEA